MLDAPKNRGQSSALYAGLVSANGDILVTMDGDGQNDPKRYSEISECLIQRYWNGLWF